MNLVGSGTVEANVAAAIFFLMMLKIYKFFSSSTYLWEKLEDMLKNSVTKHKLLVVKCLSDNRCSLGSYAVCALSLGYNEYIDLLKALKALKVLLLLGFQKAL